MPLLPPSAAFEAALRPLAGRDAPLGLLSEAPPAALAELLDGAGAAAAALLLRPLGCRRLCGAAAAAAAVPATLLLPARGSTAGVALPPVAGPRLLGRAGLKGDA